MIIAEQKPLKEILEMVEGHKTVLVVGCRSCTAICLAGGEKEAESMGEILRLADTVGIGAATVRVATVERACEREFILPLRPDEEAVLCMACGVGAQMIQECFPRTTVLPGVNTSNMGAPERVGVFVEKCAGCGDCILHRTGGICPLARCSKGLLNGPCGGSQDGKCEVSDDIPCAWDQIIKVLAERDELSSLQEIIPPKDWRPSRSGGPRRIVNIEARPGELQSRREER